MGIGVKSFYRSDCPNDMVCRTDASTIETYNATLGKFIETKINKDGECNEKGIYSAYNNDKLGFNKEAIADYNRANNFNYFIFLLQIMFQDNQIRVWYDECDTNPCDDLVTRNSILDEYKIPAMIKKLGCLGYANKELVDLVKELGWSTETPLLQPREGINYMCITSETNPDVCSCEDSIYTIF